MSELPSKLRKYEVNAREWYDSDLPFLSEAADALEAKDQIITELVALAEEYADSIDYADGYSGEVRALISKAKASVK